MLSPCCRLFHGGISETVAQKMATALLGAEASGKGEPTPLKANSADISVVFVHYPDIGNFNLTGPLEILAKTKQNKKKSLSKFQHIVHYVYILTFYLFYLTLNILDHLHTP